MKMLCPFFQCPCHENDCQAFERAQNEYRCLREGYGINETDAFERYFADTPRGVDDVRVNRSHIYCHALKRELPEVVVKKSPKMLYIGELPVRVSDCPHCGAEPSGTDRVGRVQIECERMKTRHCRGFIANTAEEAIKLWEEQEGMSDEKAKNS